MRLHRFIAENMDVILKEWEDFARKFRPVGGDLDVNDLRDHARKMLEVIVGDMAAEQSASEQTRRPQGDSLKTGVATAAEEHRDELLGAGFSIRLLVAEYRALRASVLRLWLSSETSRAQDSASHMDDVIRFNEAIDQALADSVSRYSESVTENSGIFVGLLGHDLRSPLQVLSFGAAKLQKIEDAENLSNPLGTMMVSSVHRMKEMLDNLMDFTQSRLGTGLKIRFGPANLAAIVHQLVEEFRSVHHDHHFECLVSGDCTGTWDRLRVAQICQNLISNAMEHGDANGEIVVTCEGSDDQVILTVRNDGTPIPVTLQQEIFEILNRKHHEQDNPSRNLGLGLHIVKELVTAHNGSIQIESTERAGTVFSVMLPKVQRKD